jgi:ergothioneine biosynthesis protein EgtB
MERYSLGECYQLVRRQSETLCQPLQVEDYGLQAMASVSPPKWHLAHTSWFFETFLLKPFLPRYQSPDPRFEQLFNSYYNALGEPFPRERRGLLSRPTVSEVYRYRQTVDNAVAELLGEETHRERALIAPRLVLGLHHEQQHQELLCTDIKYNLAQNPLLPVYRPLQEPPSTAPVSAPLHWQSYAGGIVELGAGPTADDGETTLFSQFRFDNEGPRHRHWLDPFELATRPVTCGDFLAFIDDDGYRRPELWLADGWQRVCQARWQAPLYWQHQEGGSEWSLFTVHGLMPLDPAQPVCHVSYYEADAFARWSGARLPTEAEWEHAASGVPVEGHFINDGILQPRCAGDRGATQQLFGDVWEWTASPYLPYPGFRASAGALGEYNGKFMCNQMVLRGGSCASERSHLRASYRNFFYPHERWQFSGLRLARSHDG